MATLQKIRNRGGILVSFVIGLALIAFIVGDAFSSGASIFNRSRLKIGEVAGESFGYQDYYQLITRNEDMAKSSNGLTSLNEQQQYEVREQTWNQLVSETILNKEYENIGLAVGGAELFDLMLGENMNPNIQQLFTNPNTGTVDRDYAQMVVGQILSMENNNPNKQYWLFMEEQVANAALQNKYNNLVFKGLFITDEEAKQYLGNSSSLSDISYIFKSYNLVNDADVQVSQNEIKDYYNSHKYLFKQEESRQIAYVNFNVDPSAEDIRETEEWVKEIVPEFEEASNPREFANLSSEKRLPAVYYAKGEIENEDLDRFVFEEKGDGVFGPYLENNAYNIARVAERTMLPDTVRARHILLQPRTQEQFISMSVLADSIANMIRGGADFEMLARQYSDDQNSAINGGDLGWFSAGDMVQPFSDSAFVAAKNEVKIAITQFGIHVLQVTDRGPLKEKVSLAVISKEITPSQQTINKVYNDARNFAHNLTNLASFDKAIEENNLTKRIGNISKNDRSISGMDNARELVRQAFLSKETGKILYSKDESSPIFETGDQFTVAVLTDIKEEGYSPLNSVSSTIERELIKKKKGELIAKEMQAAIPGSGSLMSIGQKLNLEVADATDITFNTFQIPGPGIEPKVIATIAGLEENKISEPIIGNQGVYIVVVTNRTVEPINDGEIEDVKRSLTQNNMFKVSYRLLPALVEESNVVDLRYKFY